MSLFFSDNPIADNSNNVEPVFSNTFRSHNQANGVNPSTGAPGPGYHSLFSTTPVIHHAPHHHPIYSNIKDRTRHLPPPLNNGTSPFAQLSSIPEPAPAPTFPRFTLLPAELRLRIWQDALTAACEYGRVHRVRLVISRPDEDAQIRQENEKRRAKAPVPGVAARLPPSAVPMPLSLPPLGARRNSDVSTGTGIGAGSSNDLRGVTTTTLVNLPLQLSLRSPLSPYRALASPLKSATRETGRDLGLPRSPLDAMFDSYQQQQQDLLGDDQEAQTQPHTDDSNSDHALGSPFVSEHDVVSLALPARRSDLAASTRQTRALLASCYEGRQVALHKPSSMSCSSSSFPSYLGFLPDVLPLQEGHVLRCNLTRDVILLEDATACLLVQTHWLTRRYPAKLAFLRGVQNLALDALGDRDGLLDMVAGHPLCEAAISHLAASLPRLRALYLAMPPVGLGPGALGVVGRHAEWWRRRQAEETMGRRRAGAGSSGGGGGGGGGRDLGEEARMGGGTNTVSQGPMGVGDEEQWMDLELGVATNVDQNKDEEVDLADDFDIDNVQNTFYDTQMTDAHDDAGFYGDDDDGAVPYSPRTHHPVGAGLAQPPNNSQNDVYIDLDVHSEPILPTAPFTPANHQTNHSSSSSSPANPADHMGNRFFPPTALFLGNDRQADWYSCCPPLPGPWQDRVYHGHLHCLTLMLCSIRQALNEPPAVPIVLGVPAAAAADAAAQPAAAASVTAFPGSFSTGTVAGHITITSTTTTTTATTTTTTATTAASNYYQDYLTDNPAVLDLYSSPGDAHARGSNITSNTQQPQQRFARLKDIRIGILRHHRDARAYGWGWAPLSDEQVSIVQRSLLALVTRVAGEDGFGAHGGGGAGDGEGGGDGQVVEDEDADVVLGMDADQDEGYYSSGEVDVEGVMLDV